MSFIFAVELQILNDSAEISWFIDAKMNMD